jgi:hypothetical protein
MRACGDSLGEVGEGDRQLWKKRMFVLSGTTLYYMKALTVRCGCLPRSEPQNRVADPMPAYIGRGAHWGGGSGALYGGAVSRGRDQRAPRLCGRGPDSQLLSARGVLCRGTRVDGGPRGGGRQRPARRAHRVARIDQRGVGYQGASRACACARARAGTHAPGCAPLRMAVVQYSRGRTPVPQLDAYVEAPDESDGELETRGRVAAVAVRGSASAARNAAAVGAAGTAGSDDEDDDDDDDSDAGSASDGGDAREDDDEDERNTSSERATSPALPRATLSDAAAALAPAASTATTVAPGAAASAPPAEGTTTLFRLNSVASKVIKKCGVLAGSAYLQATLGPALTAIANDPTGMEVRGACFPVPAPIVKELPACGAQLPRMCRCQVIDRAYGGVGRMTSGGPDAAGSWGGPAHPPGQAAHGVCVAAAGHPGRPARHARPNGRCVPNPPPRGRAPVPRQRRPRRRYAPAIFFSRIGVTAAGAPLTHPGGGGACRRVPVSALLLPGVGAASSARAWGGPGGGSIDTGR